MTGPLPHFVAPMLAKKVEPFDSEQHYFELKWDGMRILAFAEGGRYRLVSRRKLDCTHIYPELGFLAHLPAGTVLDGELIVMHGGQPDFTRLMSRERMGNPRTIHHAATTMPATLVAFDILYSGYRSVMKLPLADRRKRLLDALEGHCGPRLAACEGIVGSGVRLFQEVNKRGLEGIVAKRLSGRYIPGQRNWLKSKRRSRLPCVVVGFLPDGKRDFESLLLATNGPDGLQFVGSVGAGFNAAMRERINDILHGTLSARPVLHIRQRAKWVEPTIYCWVSYMMRTDYGQLRDPVFEELVA